MLPALARLEWHRLSERAGGHDLSGAKAIRESLQQPVQRIQWPTEDIRPAPGRCQDAIPQQLAGRRPQPPDRLRVDLHLRTDRQRGMYAGVSDSR